MYQPKNYSSRYRSVPSTRRVPYGNNSQRPTMSHRPSAQMPQRPHDPRFQQFQQQFQQSRSNSLSVPRTYNFPRPKVQKQTAPYQKTTGKQHVLYYSKYCPHSISFLNELCKMPIYSQFLCINVLEKKYPIPPGIKSVPTIIVPEVDGPLVGEQLFKWLEMISKKKEKEKEIESYSIDMVGGIGSSSYSYLSDDNTVGKCESSIMKSFSFLNAPEQKIPVMDQNKFVNTKPKISKSMSSLKRPPMPQGIQNQGVQGSAARRPMMVAQQSKASESQSEMNKKLNELKALRQNL